MSKLLNGAGRIASSAPHPAALEKPETCGSCRWCKPVDANQGACFGAPPTPVIAGMGQDLAGQAAANIIALRPMLEYGTPMCRAYERRPSVIIGQPQGAA